ncbi:Tmtc2 [Phodopus roborovskii]|uniref:dolichyl-phosphate-mannose--protein mannosyltransferase n=1 Tax=Phodopus roborovskii TaxID=109678 RepID=A0AAV0A7J7_PHORO|nr:Tmtc2 [Phodopus roborovskii]
MSHTIGVKLEIKTFIRDSWHTPLLLPALRRWRQADLCEFKASLPWTEVFYINLLIQDPLNGTASPRPPNIVSNLATRKNLSLFLSVSLLTFWGTSLLGARLYWMGNRPPSFSNSDNPAADSDSLLARTLTFFYLPTKNLWLLLCPDTLSFDWSMDAVPLLKTVCDWRNLHTVAFYSGLLLLAYCGLKNPSLERECNGKAVTNGKQNANGHSCHADMEYRNSEIKPSFASKVENGIKNNISQRTQLPSTENIVVLSLSLLIIPFIPATNLFFYVGFVIAERVLYIPSMGFCLLITVGARALYVKVQRRFLKSLVFYATAMLIVFYGLKTAVRNGDWQNEEMLYRSGIKVNPAKAWGNLGNVLKSQSKIAEAESAYRNALYYRTAYLNTGIILMNQGKTEEARRTFLKCSEIPDENLKDPHAHKSSVTSCLYNLGKLYHEQGHYEEALSVYKDAIQKMPRQFAPQSLYNMMGEAYMRLSKLPEAEHWYTESLRSKTDHIPAHLTYGKLLALTVNLTPSSGVQANRQTECYLHNNHILWANTFLNILILKPLLGKKISEINLRASCAQRHSVNGYSEKYESFHFSKNTLKKACICLNGQTEMAIFLYIVLIQIPGLSSMVSSKLKVWQILSPVCYI